MPLKTVVFGGTGFLGRRVVRHLLDRGDGVRAASRHAGRDRLALFGDRAAGLELVEADIGDAASIRRAVGDASGVVNAVSLYRERGPQSFQGVHVEAAARLATLCREAGVARLVHVSGIGADPASSSPYIRSRGEGELAVRAVFPEATIIRPSVMFGPDDAFLVPIVGLLRRFPAFPLFGQGRTSLQPTHVEDVAEAIVRLIAGAQGQPLFEFGGPAIYQYRGLLEAVCKHYGWRRALVPVPFWVWHSCAHVAELLPRAAITRNQVELMKADNVASAGLPGFESLSIESRGIETVLRAL